jgi:spermidine synthase
VAAYGRSGDLFRFYEINPAVVRIASQQFHFLSSSAARTEVLTGDGRLLLEKEPPDSFDVLLLDAFSDDTIPVHLITREAFGLYFGLLHRDGVLAIHLTNRYIDLDPVVDALVAEHRKRVVHLHSIARPEEQVLDADWTIVFGRDEAAARNVEAQNLWTDGYSNLFSVLK